MFNFTYIHTVKYFYFFILLFIIGSCSLNATQESALNQSKNEYIGAINEGIIISYVAYTHPNAVRYYKDHGDEVFLNRNFGTKETLFSFMSYRQMMANPAIFLEEKDYFNNKIIKPKDRLIKK